jgi:hypothetical protein
MPNSPLDMLRETIGVVATLPRRHLETSVRFKTDPSTEEAHLSQTGDMDLLLLRPVKPEGWTIVLVETMDSAVEVGETGWAGPLIKGATDDG